LRFLSPETPGLAGPSPSLTLVTSGKILFRLWQRFGGREAESCKPPPFCGANRCRGALAGPTPMTLRRRTCTNEPAPKNLRR